MWKTALLLILTLVLIPVIAFWIDDPLSILQKALLAELAIICLAGSSLYLY